MLMTVRWRHNRHLTNWPALSEIKDHAADLQQGVKKALCFSTISLQVLKKSLSNLNSEKNFPHWFPQIWCLNKSISAGHKRITSEKCAKSMREIPDGHCKFQNHPGLEVSVCFKLYVDSSYNCKVMVPRVFTFWNLVTQKLKMAAPKQKTSGLTQVSSW